MKYYFVHPEEDEDDVTLVVEKDNPAPVLPSDKVLERLQGFGMRNLPDVPKHEEMEEVEEEEHSYHSSCSEVDGDDNRGKRHTPKSVILKQKFEMLRNAYSVDPVPSLIDTEQAAGSRTIVPLNGGRKKPDWKERYQVSTQHPSLEPAERRVTFNSPGKQGGSPQKGTKGKNYITAANGAIKI